jgi:phosphatidylinositol-3,4,5-trisphosphate 3-phosphatase and dual-specificity protein phosphatase PTEN
MDSMPADEDTQQALVDDAASDPPADAPGEPAALAKPADASEAGTPAGVRTPVGGAHPAPLQHVLDLHTSKRMRALEAKQAGALSAEKQKKGVSIPSQRRWLLYWSLLLAGAGPRGFWDPRPRPQARVVSVRVRVREPRGALPVLARAVNTLMDQGRGARRDEVWVSLARYDDALVQTLEAWERHTRAGDTRLGERRVGSESMEGEALADLFTTSKWDKEKVPPSVSLAEDVF